jgi:hypothetical protein
MQLVSVGRNEPCPCGSGRKYKKCCLEARDAAVAGGEADLDVRAVVDAAIDTDDWTAAHEHVDQAMALFARDRPLEHVRFDHNLLEAHEPDAAELARWCTPGWLRWCELELAYVVDRFELAHEQRQGLRVALHLLRRFGARSPVLEELARIQVAEQVHRRRQLANAMSARGWTMANLPVNGPELADWIEQTKPVVLGFADWFALRSADEQTLPGVWRSGAGVRACDACLERLDEPALPDAVRWIQIAMLANLGDIVGVATMLAFATVPRTANEDERMVYESLVLKRDSPTNRGSLQRVLAASDARCDFAGSAMLRGVFHRVQLARR